MSSFETAARLELPGGTLAYTLRRSPRARRLRVLVDPRRGVIVTVPLGRAGRARADQAAGSVAGGAVSSVAGSTPDPAVDPAVEAFLREREAWLRRHLERQAGARARAVTGGELDSGLVVLFRGAPHVIRLDTAARGSLHRSTVSREGLDGGDELVVRLAARDRRPPAVILRAWLIDRAGRAIEQEIDRHGTALGVAPAAVTLRDPRTRWGSASRTGRLSFSWRLVLAPPEALETVVVHELAHLRVFGHGPAFWALVASRRPDHAAWRRWLRDHSIELHATLGDHEGVR